MSALDGYLRSRWQVALSAVGMIGVINSVLLGAVGGFAVAAIASGPLWPSILVAAVVFAIAMVLHQRYQLHARSRKPFRSLPPNSVSALVHCSSPQRRRCRADQGPMPRRG